MNSDPFDALTLFQGFSPQEIAFLRPLFHPYHTPDGEILFNQGEPARNFYIIVDGEVVIRYKPEDGPALILTRVHKEGVVGWSAAIGSPTYTSSAVCVENCQLLRVCSEELRQFYEVHPETAQKLLERLAAVIAERLRQTHPQIMALLEQGLHSQTAQTVSAEWED
jgi:CRP-like cAMP-binding protein